MTPSADSATHSYEYPRPALTVDVVLLSGGPPRREVLLIRRGKEPFLGMWALPGGFVDELEPLERAARRELCEETGLALEVPLLKVGTFGDPGRDPRGWVVTAAFVAILEGDTARRRILAGDDAAEARWHPVDELPELASDHAAIIAAALERVGRGN